MPNPWFRLYAEFATDPKVQRLSEELQRRFVMILCLKCAGVIPTNSDDEIAFALRISAKKVRVTKAKFVELGLIRENWDPVKWRKRQYLSDSSTARTRAYRERRKRDVSGTSPARHDGVAATAPDADSDQTQNRSRAEGETPPAPLAAQGGRRRIRARDADAAATLAWNKARAALESDGVRYRPVRFGDRLIHAVIAAIAPPGGSGPWPSLCRLADEARRSMSMEEYGRFMRNLQATFEKTYRGLLAQRPEHVPDTLAGSRNDREPVMVG